MSHGTKFPPLPLVHEPLLTPAEVATMFRVDPKTVTRWAKAGKLTSIRTLGGHRRYREIEVRELLAAPPAAPITRVRDVQPGSRIRLGGVLLEVTAVAGDGRGVRALTLASGEVLRLPALQGITIEPESIQQRAAAEPEIAEPSPPTRVCDVQAGDTVSLDGTAYIIAKTAGDGRGMRTLTTTTGDRLTLPALMSIHITHDGAR